jgi:DNA-binding beta-propeller fold protein YncE
LLVAQSVAFTTLAAQEAATPDPVLRDTALGGTALVANEGSAGAMIAVVDLATGSLARHIDLGNFQRPHGAVFIPGSNHAVAIASEASQRLLLVDIDSDPVVPVDQLE